MLEKFKKRKTENLILLLILLVITLVLMNNILKDEKEEKQENKIQGSTLANGIPIEQKLEDMLGKIDGVGNVSILLT